MATSALYSSTCVTICYKLTTAIVNDVLYEDNYLTWELNARTKLAKKALLEHIDALKATSEGDANASESNFNNIVMGFYTTVGKLVNIHKFLVGLRKKRPPDQLAQASDGCFASFVSFGRVPLFNTSLS